MHASFLEGALKFLAHSGTPDALASFKLHCRRTREIIYQRRVLGTRLCVTNPYEEVRLAHSLKRTVGRRFRFSPSQSSFLPPSPLSIMICTAAERIGLIWR